MTFAGPDDVAGGAGVRGGEDEGNGGGAGGGKGGTVGLGGGNGGSKADGVMLQPYSGSDLPAASSGVYIYIR